MSIIMDIGDTNIMNLQRISIFQTLVYRNLTKTIEHNKLVEQMVNNLYKKINK